MKVKFFFLCLVMGLVMLTCFAQTTAFAQASIIGDWLVDITGDEDGGAVLTIGASTITGYAFIANRGYLYPISGVYDPIDLKGKFTGHFDVPDIEEFTGKLDKNGSFTLKGNGKKYKGTILPIQDPAIPSNWTVKVS